MIEDCFADSFADTLKRVFIPCKKVVFQEKAINACCIEMCKILRNFVASDFEECTVSGGGYILLDYGKELTGGIRIVTGNMNPVRVRIRFGESVSECCGDPTADHAFHDTELTLPRYASLDFGDTGFRFVRIDVCCDEELHLVNILAFAMMRELEKKGTFISSDRRLNEIYDTAVHTVHLNIQDTILDGVKRDRLIWGGDMHPEVSAILRVFGAVDEIDRSLEQLCFHTRNGEYINTLSSYNLWVLLCIRDLWFYSGKKELLEKYAPYIERQKMFFTQSFKADGSFRLIGNHLFLDWPSDRDTDAVHAGLAGLFVLAGNAFIEMAEHLGIDSSAVSCAAERIKASVPDPGENKTAAALQHLAGLADRGRVFRNCEFENISTFLGYYVLLAKENRSALELILRYWGGMLDMGATSFWEDFDLKWCKNASRIDELPVPGKSDIHADFGDHCYCGLRHSLCHGWAAGPAAWCSEKILGVKPAAPGFRKIVFTPDLCGLEWANGSVPTPYGNIKVELCRGREPFVQLPDGVELV